MFLTGGFYEMLVSPSISLVALNTVVYSPKRTPYHDVEHDPIGQFAWLRATLQRARSEMRKCVQGRAEQGEARRCIMERPTMLRVYVTGHIAPGSSTYKDEKLWEEAYSDAYLAIVHEVVQLLVLLLLLNMMHCVAFLNCAAVY